VSRLPRLLPIIAVSIGGVLAINALAGARDLPGLLSATKAFAEDAVAKGKAGKDAKAEPVKLAAASPLPPRQSPAQAAAASAATGACKPTDAAIGKEAGLSPEQMRLLENLQARRGQLDDREKAMEMQLNLIAAAAAKLDARVAALNALKADIQGMLGQADAKQKAETDRMVGVYTTMAQQKPKEAAKQLTIMDDSVRLPIAAGLSNRNLATILANMSPADAKKLNEALVHRFENPKLDGAKAALTAPAAAAPAPPPKTPPSKPAPVKPVGKAAAAVPTDAPPADPAAKPAPVKTAQAESKPAPKRRPRPAAKKPDPADAAAPMKTDPSLAKAPAG
jgi:flagellar motility protein MotE (MotC chaperone)